MAPRKGSFATAAAPAMLYGDLGEHQGFGPSSSGRTHLHSSPGSNSTSSGSGVTATNPDVTAPFLSAAAGVSPPVHDWWVWTLSPYGPDSSTAATVTSAVPSAPSWPWMRQTNCRNHGSNRNNGDGGRMAAQTSEGQRSHQQRHPQQEQHVWGEQPCGGRAMLLASLTTSAVAAAAAAAGAATAAGSTSSAAPASAPAATAGGSRSVGSSGGGMLGGAGDGGGSSSSSIARHGFHLPQLSIMRLPPLGAPPAFAAEQCLAQELLDYHTAKHGGYPRPCPLCNSAEFMVAQSQPRSPACTPCSSSSSSTSPTSTSTTINTSSISSSSTATSPSSATSSSNSTSTSSSSSSPSSSSSSPDGAAVVSWSSRPLSCEGCGRWVHLGCAGVGALEQLPPRPWFHCRTCRDTYLRLEAAAERNPHPSSASPAHSLFLLTPADLAAAAAGAGRIRGPARAVMPLLAQGFNEDAIRGFGQPAREYDGGRYAAVLVHPSSGPLAAATFNVFSGAAEEAQRGQGHAGHGVGAEAQLCLLATADQHRMKGNATALVADLEALLASMGVRRVLVQARPSALGPLWLGRWGYSLLQPEEVSELHGRLPLSYYDCAVAAKKLLG